VCFETVAAVTELCPECGEPTVIATMPPSSELALRLAGIGGWLRMHWRPFITMTTLGALIATGIALRHLAPNRYRPPEKINPQAAATPVCDAPCWHGEACEMGRCVWAPPNDAGHLGERPSIAGPFPLPGDVVDVMPLDGERYAATHLLGVQLYGSRTGDPLALVSNAPQAQRMLRVGAALYVASPKRIYVLDAGTTKVLKTVEIGSSVDQMVLGASGQRVLASVPGARSVAVIATDYHAEISRFYFGDDPVGPVVLDDTGERALTTTGRVPLPGLKPPRSATSFGAMYAFDPSRLASEQDRVRTGMVGNPVDLLMAPDSRSSFVLLREESTLVPIERLASGAVRLLDRLDTCKQPEEIVLVRRGRRALVRCNLGRAIDVVDLESRARVRRIPLNARVSDLVVTPDGRQALFTLPRDGRGALGVLDLDNYHLELHPLGGEPHRVRLTPDGRQAVVISDRSKAAWVVR